MKESSDSEPRRGAGEAFEDMKQMGLSGAQPLGEVKTKNSNSN